MFTDRKDAGRQLADALTAYADEDALVLAIPRGGVEVGFQIAQKLNLPFSTIIVRKLPFPRNPEAGFGAIAEDGSTFLIDRATGQIAPEDMNNILAAQKKEVNRRIQVLRQGEPLPHITGKTVILVDDGIAMGSTMRAAIMLCRNKQAQKVVVAAPVSGPDNAEAFKAIADDVLILEKPSSFRAVAQAYRNWYDVSDEEVIQIMQKTSHPNS